VVVYHRQINPQGHFFGNVKIMPPCRHRVSMVDAALKEVEGFPKLQYRHIPVVPYNSKSSVESVASNEQSDPVHSTVNTAFGASE